METTLSISEHRPVPIDWVKKLFLKMETMYGNKFIDMWRGTKIELVHELWAEEMGKLSREELKRGTAALMNQDWPPSLPQYIKLCKPTVDKLVAYYEAIAGVQARQNGEMGIWSHPAIYWAAIPLSFDLGTQTYSQIKVRWERALDEQMECGEWAIIPKPVPKECRLTFSNSELSKENAAKVLEEIGGSNIVKRSTNDTHHKDWISKVKERKKKGDKTLPSISIKFADEALKTR